MKRKNIITIVLAILGAIILFIGVPLIINECYKANRGYITVWDGADVLGYYGTILGAAIAVLTLVATIAFTKKQIQRESYLRAETDKLSKLESIFLGILDSINPIETLKNVMDNGFSDPTKAINILQKYQLNCKTANDRLNAHLNMSDYPKFKVIIDSIANIAEEFVNISQGEIDQYSNLLLWTHRETAIKMLRNEEILPGSFSFQAIAFSKDVLEKTKDIDYVDIEKAIAQLNEEFIKAYETKFRSLLQLNGSTFEEVNAEVQQRADEILRLRRK
ncbi:MAG: hypothetical protein E7535_06255 [Ruminococcaceae bacterium]|nr:hypothetical protein [Oscillospiraceae bacterium]